MSQRLLGFSLVGGWVDEAQRLAGVDGLEVGDPVDVRMLTGETVHYVVTAAERDLRLKALARLASGLDLPLDLIEDQRHIIRGEN